MRRRLYQRRKQERSHLGSQSFILYFMNESGMTRSIPQDPHSQECKDNTPGEQTRSKKTSQKEQVVVCTYQVAEKVSRSVHIQITFEVITMDSGFKLKRKEKSSMTTRNRKTNCSIFTQRITEGKELMSQRNKEELQVINLDKRSQAHKKLNTG